MFGELLGICVAYTCEKRLTSLGLLPKCFHKYKVKSYGDCFMYFDIYESGANFSVYRWENKKNTTLGLWVRYTKVTGVDALLLMYQKETKTHAMLSK